MKKEFKKGDRVRGLGRYDGRDLTGKLGTVLGDLGSNIAVRWDDNIDGHTCRGRCDDYHGWNVPPHLLELVQNEVIVIYRKDNEVIAHNKVTGEKATSKCHPDDKFDFMIGAKIAFNRLVNPTKIVKQDKYEVGDKVKIIDKWVDGCDENVAGRMDKWLGKVMTIRSIDSDGDYQMEEDITEWRGHGWYWNSNCIEGKVVDASEPQPEPKKLYNGKVVCVKSIFRTSLTVGKIYEFKDGYSRYDDGERFPMGTDKIESVEDINELHIGTFIELVE